jgi:hypothetical protein
MKVSIKNKKNDTTNTLTSLYVEYDQAPSEKLERKILQLEESAPSGTILKLLPRKHHAVSVLKKAPDSQAGALELELFFYLDQEEKALLFRHYLYHSEEKNKTIKAVIYFLGQINSSSKETLPSGVLEKDFSIFQKELLALETLSSSPNLSIKERILISHGFTRNGHLFDLQNIHIEWMASRLSLNIVCCLFEIYLTQLKYNQNFDRALDFFKFQKIRNLDLLKQPLFFGFYFQFSLLKAYQSEAWSRRKVLSDSDREKLLILIEDEKLLIAFNSYEEQKILHQLITENKHTSRYTEVVSQNSFALLDLQVYDLKIVKTAEILAAVSMKLKTMPFGKETPRKVLGAQKILLDENFKYLGNLCHGYSFLQRC